MWYRSMFESSARSPRRRKQGATERKQQARRLLLEGLEDRHLLTFAPAASYSVGLDPDSVVAADFSQDGVLDLATANRGSSTVSVLLGNANGTFGPTQGSPTGGSPLSLATGDFNGDGKLDVVTANAGDVSVLLGNGGGGFAAPASINLDSSPNSVAVGDMNGDGKMDLVALSNLQVSDGCGWYGCYYHTEGRINILLGNGTGSFAPPAVYGAGAFYRSYGSLALADFNSDGKLDLATVQYSGVSVQLNVGGGVLGTPSNYYSNYYSASVAAGDVNGDGKTDLVTGNYDHSVSVFVNSGAGSFGVGQLYPSSLLTTSVAIADFSGDGKADLIAPDADTGTINVLLNTGAGTFGLPVNDLAGAGAATIATGDFNGDGKIDAATANLSGASVSVLLSDGVWPTPNSPALSIGSGPTVIEGNEGTTAASFTVTLSAPSTQPVSVLVTTASGTATDGVDVQTKSETVTFAPGETSKSITVLVQGDRAPETDEYYYVNLSHPTNAFVSRDRTLAWIQDDEPYAGVGDTSITEGNAGTKTLTFTVTLSAAYDADVTVDYATLDMSEEDAYYFGVSPATAGVDYVATTGTVTIPKGQTSAPIEIPIIGDRVPEGAEGFYVQLTGSNWAKVGGYAVGTIIDDEPQAYISTYPYASAPEGNTGTSPMSFTIVLSNAYDLPVTVSYTTTEGSALAGSDYVAKSGSVTFNPGETSQPIVVSILGDTVAEYDEYFGVNLTATTNATYFSGTVFGYILDDDTPPTISIGDASIMEGNSGTSLMTFVVSLSNPSGQGISVNFATANGTAKTSDNDYVAQSGSLYFTPGQTSQTIQIAIKGDTRKEQNETFQVKLSGASGASIKDGQGVGTIWNDDGSGSGGGKGRIASVSVTLDQLIVGSPKKRAR